MATRTANGRTTAMNFKGTSADPVLSDKKVADAKARKNLPKAATFKPPKTLGACADMLFEKREERLAITRSIKDDVERLSSQEGVLREHLIENLPASDATGVAGKLVRVTIKKGVAPVADDWDKIFEHVVDEVLKARRRKSPTPYGIFAILGRSLNAEAIKELWEAGVVIPGVGRFNTKSLSVNKL